MKKGVRRSQSDESSIEIGILYGCEWTAQEIATKMGVTPNAIYARNHEPAHSAVIEKVRAWTQAGVTKHINERIKAAEDDFAERKKRLHTKGYKLIEKTLDSGMAEGAEIEPIHLRAAEMGIERTEGKPLDRKAILTRNESVERPALDDADIHSILDEAERINALRRSALPLLTSGDVKDAEIVQPSR